MDYQKARDAVDMINSVETLDSVDLSVRICEDTKQPEEKRILRPPVKFERVHHPYTVMPLDNRDSITVCEPTGEDDNLFNGFDNMWGKTANSSLKQSSIPHGEMEGELLEQRRLGYLNPEGGGKYSISKFAPKTCDGSSETCDGSSETCDGSSKTCDVSSKTCDGSSKTCDGSSKTCDGSSKTCDGSSKTCDGSSEKVKKSFTVSTPNKISPAFQLALKTAMCIAMTELGRTDCDVLCDDICKSSADLLQKLKFGSDDDVH